MKDIEKRIIKYSNEIVRISKKVLDENRDRLPHLTDDFVESNRTNFIEFTTEQNNKYYCSSQETSSDESLAALKKELDAIQETDPIVEVFCIMSFTDLRIDADSKLHEFITKDPKNGIELLMEEFENFFKEIGSKRNIFFSFVMKRSGDTKVLDEYVMFDSDTLRSDRDKVTSALKIKEVASSKLILDMISDLF